MDYNKLIDQCHSTAKANGWWDEPRPHEEIILLIKSELFEAMDAYRSDKRACKDDLLQIQLCSHARAFKTIFEICLKDTFEDEIADTTIRIFDYLGFLGVHANIVGDIPIFTEVKFMEVLQKLDTKLSNMYTMDLLEFRLMDVLEHLYLIAKVYDFDLHTHIQLKLRYNATRGKKHGKKF